MNATIPARIYVLIARAAANVSPRFRDIIDDQ